MHVLITINCRKSWQTTERWRYRGNV